MTLHVLSGPPLAVPFFMRTAQSGPAVVDIPGKLLCTDPAKLGDPRGPMTAWHGAAMGGTVAELAAELARRR